MRGVTRTTQNGEILILRWWANETLTFCFANPMWFVRMHHEGMTDHLTCLHALGQV